MQRLEQAIPGIIDGVNGFAPWEAPHREAIKPQQVPFAMHNGKERRPTHSIDHGDFQIIAIPGLMGIFNITAFPRDNDSTHLLGRQLIDRQKITIGTPDTSRLVWLTMNNRHLETTPEQSIWEPGDTLGYNLEDPRAVVVSKSKRVALGLSALSEKPDDNGIYLPYPARAYVDSINPTALVDLEVITEFGPGKNFVSLGYPGEEDNWWGFRREGEGLGHELLVLHDDGKKFRAVGTLPLPKDIPGFGLKAGASATPVWIDEQWGIIPFHGMEFENGLFVYSQGVAILERGTSHEQPFAVKNPIPTLHPDHFNPLRGEDLTALELNPIIRRATYSTGLHVDVSNDIFRTLVSVGDTVTVFENRKLSKVKEMLRTKKSGVIYPSSQAA